MSKILYPNDGISSKIKPILNDSLTHLSNAQEYCAMTVPSDFEYLSYLRGLSPKIGEFKTGISNVYGKATNTDTLITSVRENLEAANETIDTSVIETRDRLVK